MGKYWIQNSQICMPKFLNIKLEKKIKITFNFGHKLFFIGKCYLGTALFTNATNIKIN